MAAVITQEFFQSRETLDVVAERSRVASEIEVLEMIELRYQGLWARVEMEVAFMHEEWVDRES